MYHYDLPHTCTRMKEHSGSTAPTYLAFASFPSAGDVEVELLLGVNDKFLTSITAQVVTYSYHIPRLEHAVYTPEGED